MIAIDSFLSEVIPSKRRPWQYPPELEIDMQRIVTFSRAYLNCYGVPPSKILMTEDQLMALIDAREFDNRLVAIREENYNRSYVAVQFRQWTIELTTQ